MVSKGNTARDSEKDSWNSSKYSPVENKIRETHYLVVSCEHFKIRNGDTSFTQNIIEGTTHITHDTSNSLFWKQLVIDQIVHGRLVIEQFYQYIPSFKIYQINMFVSNTLWGQEALHYREIHLGRPIIIPICAIFNLTIFAKHCSFMYVR